MWNLARFEVQLDSFTANAALELQLALQELLIHLLQVHWLAKLLQGFAHALNLVIVRNEVSDRRTLMEPEKMKHKTVFFV